MQLNQYKYLSTIQFPEDIRRLNVSDLPILCEELRDYIITETAENPGHLGASLGTIELAVAIHYVFNTPNDKLVWDVGHQAYAHKILTGRKKQFHTNRKYHGISGFPKMDESEYDAFGTGHASTSISAVLGMAVAGQLSGIDNRNYIAVIGDGSMGGGMAFEAINHAVETKANILIILNDNKIAIDKNVGAMSRYLLKITSSASYNRIKSRIWNFFTNKRPVHNKILRIFSNIGNAIKGFVLRGSNLFQALGFRYFGPVDGHNVIQLVHTLQDLKSISGAKLLHTITIKGKGLTLAEKNQTIYHAPGKFDPDTGEILQFTTQRQFPKYQDVFGETLLELAQQDQKVLGITPAMAIGCSMNIMRDVFPQRVFDVGIAEEHAVTFSAGLATQGFIPFCNIYASFFQRSYDQLIHDVALQKIPVIFCLDRAGLVGEDGATHHGFFDLASLRPIPNLIISAPMCATELRLMLYTAYKQRELPFVIRYPRGRDHTYEWKIPFQEITIGRARILQEGEKVAVLSLGTIGNQVTEALSLVQNVVPTHVDVRFLAPLDEELILKVMHEHDIIFTVEDGILHGGLFSAIAELAVSHHLSNKIIPIALPNRFVAQGDLPSLYREVGFDAATIANSIMKSVEI